MKNAEVRLLIVEDDIALASLLEEYLTEANYKVRTCHNGNDALHLIEKEPFDLVLTDILLPGRSGLDLLRTLKGNPEKTLVILMTGCADLADALKAVREGAYDFVNKPFQLPEIRIRLDNAVSYQQLLRRVKELEKRLSSRREWIHDNTAYRYYGKQSH